jgi:uncharacterized membrane protein
MKKPFGQRLAFVVAILCYLAALVCALAAVFYRGAQPSDPVQASLMAAVVFFIGCGVVLHVIGKARLKGVLSGSGDIDDT